MKTDKKTEQFFAEIAQVRKSLINPENRDELIAAQEKAIELIKSEQFGTYLGLSTIYKTLT